MLSHIFWKVLLYIPDMMLQIWKGCVATHNLGGLYKRRHHEVAVQSHVGPWESIFFIDGTVTLMLTNGTSLVFKYSSQNVILKKFTKLLCLSFKVFRSHDIYVGSLITMNFEILLYYHDVSINSLCNFMVISWI